jgi:hypothetical protein
MFRIASDDAIYGIFVCGGLCHPPRGYALIGLTCYSKREILSLIGFLFDISL